ncbi:MAG: 2-oxoacid:ferredoxin oxidoreductase subunit beta [Polyangiales bacterium]
MSAPIPVSALTRKDFVSDQEVRWCPGCGDYAILAAVQRTLPEIGATRENTVFVSGIGCSSRFPYYMSTYGFHTIHGRAPAIATGLKIANPKLDVWLVTGDGDGLSIGGNHMLHVLRRNVDLQILLFNNQIYGLTKGQYSPTSVHGKVTPSTPMGSLEDPLNPIHFALGAGARFVARGYDTSKDLPEVLKRAHAHKGASFVEILQNCPVFNEGAHDLITDRATAAEHQLWVEHGKPLVFGAKREKGVVMNPKTCQLEVVSLSETVTEADLVVHDETNQTLAWQLATLPGIAAMGVLYCNPGVAYDAAVVDQVEQAKTKAGGKADMNALLRSGHTWQIT